MEMTERNDQGGTQMYTQVSKEGDDRVDHHGGVREDTDALVAAIPRRRVGGGRKAGVEEQSRVPTSHDEEKMGFISAVCVTINASMGIGWLTLPYAFWQSGIIGGVVSMMVFAFLINVAKDYFIETMVYCEALAKEEDQRRRQYQYGSEVEGNSRCEDGERKSRWRAEEDASDESWHFQVRIERSDEPLIDRQEEPGIPLEQEETRREEEEGMEGVEDDVGRSWSTGSGRRGRSDHTYYSRRRPRGDQRTGHPTRPPPCFEIGDRTWELAKCGEFLIGPHMGRLVLLEYTLWVWGLILEFALVFGVSFTTLLASGLFGLPPHQCENPGSVTLTSTCYPVYALFLALFVCIVSVVAVAGLKETAWFQVVMTALRVVVMVLMMVTVLVDPSLTHFKDGLVKIKEEQKRDLWFNTDGLGIAIGILVYTLSNMDLAPSLGHAMKKEKRHLLPRVFLTSTIILAVACT